MPAEGRRSRDTFRKQTKLQKPLYVLFIGFYFIVFCSKISNVNCLVETEIHVDTILYLSLYYLVNDLIHLPKSDH